MAMTFRELNRRVFQGEPVSHVFFQPRMEPWFAWHELFQQLPERYREMNVRDFYDDLDCSMRYIHYYTGNPDPTYRVFAPEVRIRREEQGTRRQVIYETPNGDLVETHKLTVDETWRTIGFPVKTLEDLRGLLWLFQRLTYHFDKAKFMIGDAYIGDRGEPQFWVPKSPYQALAQQWMKLQDLVYALADAPALVEEVMDAIDRSYDVMYDEIVRSDCVRILNFGENIHDQLISPRYWERYFVPFFQKRCDQLHAAGIYSHVHIDGFFRSLLPYLRNIPCDGIEALTPRPQGDVELEEMAEHIGDKVVLDGIPAVLFMPQYSREELMATVEKLVALFPRLILGISDELPEGTGGEAAERVRMVARWARQKTLSGT